MECRSRVVWRNLAPAEETEFQSISERISRLRGLHTERDEFTLRDLYTGPGGTGMTLLIAWFLIYNFEMSFAWYIVTVIAWLFHIAVRE
jgi:hypothetical protein